MFSIGGLQRGLHFIAHADRRISCHPGFLKRRRKACYIFHTFCLPLRDPRSPLVDPEDGLMSSIAGEEGHKERPEEPKKEKPLPARRERLVLGKTGGETQ